MYIHVSFEFIWKHFGCWSEKPFHKPTTSLPPNPVSDLVPLFWHRNLKASALLSLFLHTTSKHPIWYRYFCIANSRPLYFWLESIRFGTAPFATELTSIRFGTATFSIRFDTATFATHLHSIRFGTATLAPQLQSIQFRTATFATHLQASDLVPLLLHHNLIHSIWYRYSCNTTSKPPISHRYCPNVNAKLPIWCRCVWLKRIRFGTMPK